MSASSALRIQIEAALSKRIPAALTPAPRLHQPVAVTGIAPVDELLRGGLPLGAMTEIVGPECSGRTSLALSFIANMTKASRVCAWVDVSDTLSPESAAAAGIDLNRLLWVRCGVTRSPPLSSASLPHNPKPVPCPTPWSRMGDALRVTDLLLQGGGFSAIVLDMGCIAPEYALRVPLATWFRYRAGAERTQASILLLTQQPCAKSSAGLVLRLHPGEVARTEGTVLTGMDYRLDLGRQRFQPIADNVVPLRKPPQPEDSTRWKSRTFWAATR